MNASTQVKNHFNAKFVKNHFPVIQILKGMRQSRDEFGPKFFGPGLKWAMEIMARPGHVPKPMSAFGPGQAWAKF